MTSDESFEFPSALEETDEEVRRRIKLEEKMYLRNKLQKSKSPKIPKSRVSYKTKRGESIVNKRRLKACPICHKVNKQLTRHIKTVHSDVNGVVLNEACKLAKVRQLSEPIKSGKNEKTPCPICGTQRRNVRSHLIKVHNIKRDSKLLGELQPVLEVSADNIKNNCVAEWMKEYQRLHFNQLDGACLSSKLATRKKQINQKVNSVGRMLDFLLIQAKECTIEGALAEIRELFARPDGYAWTHKGKYATLIKEFDYLKEFCAYARREGLASVLVVSTAIERLTMARQNAKKKQNHESALFQDEDRKLVLLQSDILAFNASPLAKKAMTELKGDKKFRSRMAVNARNFVITTWLLENNCRPSDLDDITLANLDEAKMRPMREEDGTKYYSVCSTTSKNVGSSGLPTYLLISIETMELLDNYRHKARSVIATPASGDSLFLKENGEPMVHENISQGYRSIWKAAALKNPEFKKDCNSRHFRHSANGIAHLCGDEELRQTVHIGLNHDAKSNEASYKSIIRPAVTLKVKRKIKKLRNDSSDKFEHLLKGGANDVVSHQEIEDTSQPETTQVGSRTRAKAAGMTKSLSAKRARLESKAAKTPEANDEFAHQQIEDASQSETTLVESRTRAKSVRLKKSMSAKSCLLYTSPSPRDS